MDINVTMVEFIKLKHGAVILLTPCSYLTLIFACCRMVGNGERNQECNDAIRGPFVKSPAASDTSG